MESVASVSTPIPRIPSGIDVVDAQWGGLYRGGSYLVYGPPASGHRLLPLAFVRTGVRLGASSLLISPERPKDLTIQAAAIGFDLRGAHAAGRVRLMRIPPLFNLQNVGDDGVARALQDLAALIRQHQPDRLAITDFTPFVQFRSFERMQRELLHLFEQIDPVATTLLLALDEPTTPREDDTITFLQNQVTGSVHVELVEGDISTRRRLTLVPHIGHLRRVIVEDWDLTRLGAAEAANEAPSRTETPPPPADLPTLEAPTFTIEPTGFVPVPPPEPTGATQPETPAPATLTVEEELPDTPDFIYEDREAFRDRLQQHFVQRDQDATPFLLLAMRMDQSEGAVRPLAFDFLMDLVSETLRDEDAMLADTEKERLVVLLGNSRPEEAQYFFSRLKNRLRQEAPEQADHLLHAVSAIVVPDGRPFRTADEFLTYALDED
ncbi:MAG: hypothetical protein D6746_01055 [Bacteroidetes bacterium]|nr:MAG: hypothetical protein D6746_01055 [Bacteroidota bacterium]